MLLWGTPPPTPENIPIGTLSDWIFCYQLWKIVPLRLYYCLIQSSVQGHHVRIQFIPVVYEVVEWENTHSRVGGLSHWQ